MYSTIFTLMCFILLVGGHDVPGYYWRDFYGSIPEDAFPGGRDLVNKPIYIGQIYSKYLIPAKIYSNDKHAYFEYGGEESNVINNVKILCTQHPEQFVWIPTSTKDINAISNITLVLGGYEPGCTTYIGRTRRGGEVLVGKALADNLPQYAGLHVTQNGAKYRVTSFEVLAFNSEDTLEVLAAK